MDGAGRSPNVRALHHRMLDFLMTRLKYTKRTDYNIRAVPAQRQPDRIETLPLDQIRLDFQPIECLIEDDENHYIAAFRGDKVDSVRVFFDGTEYRLADGFHRVAAARQLGYQKIKAEVVPGTYADLEAEWEQGREAIEGSLRGEQNP